MTVPPLLARTAAPGARSSRDAAAREHARAEIQRFRCTRRMALLRRIFARLGIAFSAARFATRRRR